MYISRNYTISSNQQTYSDDEESGDTKHGFANSYLEFSSRMFEYINKVDQQDSTSAVTQDRAFAALIQALNSSKALENKRVYNPPPLYDGVSMKRVDLAECSIEPNDVVAVQFEIEFYTNQRKSETEKVEYFAFRPLIQEDIFMWRHNSLPPPLTACGDDDRIDGLDDEDDANANAMNVGLLGATPAGLYITPEDKVHDEYRSAVFERHKYQYENKTQLEHETKQGNTLTVTDVDTGKELHGNPHRSPGDAEEIEQTRKRQRHLNDVSRALNQFETTIHEIQIRIFTEFCNNDENRCKYTCELLDLQASRMFDEWLSKRELDLKHEYDDDNNAAAEQQPLDIADDIAQRQMKFIGQVKPLLAARLVDHELVQKTINQYALDSDGTSDNSRACTAMVQYVPGSARTAIDIFDPHRPTDNSQIEINGVKLSRDNAKVIHESLNAMSIERIRAHRDNGVSTGMPAISALRMREIMDELRQ